MLTLWIGWLWIMNLVFLNEERKKEKRRRKKKLNVCFEFKFEFLLVVTLSPEAIILTCAFTTQSWVSFSVPCCCCSTFCQRCDCFVFVLAVWFEFDALLIWTWLVFCLVFVFVFGLDPCWVVKKWGIIRELDQILSTLFWD